MKYWAFISYCHTDAQIAHQLHRRLEMYHFPKSLVGALNAHGAIPPRLFPIFIDNEELSGGSNLNEKLRLSLEQSKNLIIICSPASARSKYVQEEVKIFRSIGREKQIYCVIASGEPEACRRGYDLEQECLPESLTEGNQELPLAVDLRGGTDAFERSTIRLISGIVGLSFDDLWKREQQRQKSSLRRRRNFWGAALGTLLFSFIIISDYGMRFFGAEEIRNVIDTFNVSVLRPTKSLDQIQVAALELRSKMKKHIDRHRLPTNIFGEVSTALSSAESIWVSGQVLTGIMLMENLPDHEAQNAIKTVDAMFVHKESKWIDGQFRGWSNRPGEPAQAEITLWVATGLCLLSKSKSSFAGQAANYHKQLVQTLDGIYPIGSTGGWISWENQLQREQYDTYISCLALFYLSVCGEDVVNFNGIDYRCKDLARVTAQWLISKYEKRGKASGWRRIPSSNESLFDGLTIQILATLLFAEKNKIITLPEHINEEVVLRIEQIGLRHPDYFLSTGEVMAEFESNKSNKLLIESVTFDFYPWALMLCSLWIERDSQMPGPAFIRTRVLRTLSDLTVYQGSQYIESRKTQLWQSAETLIGLNFAVQITEKNDY